MTEHCQSNCGKVFCLNKLDFAEYARITFIFHEKTFWYKYVTHFSLIRLLNFCCLYEVLLKNFLGKRKPWKSTLRLFLTTILFYKFHILWVPQDLPSLLSHVYACWRFWDFPLFHMSVSLCDFLIQRKSLSVVSGIPSAKTEKGPQSIDKINLLYITSEIYRMWQATSDRLLFDTRYDKKLKIFLLRYEWRKGRI